MAVGSQGRKSERIVKHKKMLRKGTIKLKPLWIGLVLLIVGSVGSASAQFRNGEVLIGIGGAGIITSQGRGAAISTSCEYGLFSVGSDD